MANRRTRKTGGKRAASPWVKHVTKVYREMKRKDKNVKLGQAMRAASKSWKKGGTRKA